MDLKLLEVEAVPDSPTDHWKVRAISVNGKAPALSTLSSWSKNEKADFRKIIKALRLAAATKKRVTDPRLVKKCATYDGVYEARADKGSARLMFFYSEAEEMIIVCTDGFWKGGNQDTAFKHCADFKSLFDKNYYEQPKRRSVR